MKPFGAQLALFDAFMHRIPTEHGVTFSSVDQSLDSFALVVAPNIGGALALPFGVREALLVFTCLGLAACVLFATDPGTGRVRRSDARVAAR